MVRLIKKHINTVVGFLSGIINGLLGAGGGMLVVPALKARTQARKAHATTVAVIFPMCLVSSIWYLAAGRVTVSDALPYAPYGVIGAAIGAFLLTKLNGRWLRIIFSVLMIWAGVRMIMR